MNLRIEEIRYKNIREIGSLDLDFTKGQSSDTHQISLVQMPNGTGKTTTMGLIRHLILGAELEEDAVMAYEPEYGASEGEFTMGFATADERFRLHMHLDYDVGSITYRHSYPQRQGGGMNSGHYLPLELQSVLTKEFVNLFIFNGELTEDFIETGEDKAEQALKITNRLDRIEAQIPAIERVVEQEQDDEGAKTEQGLKQTISNLEKRRIKLSELESLRSNLRVDIEGHQKEIERLKKDRKEIIAEDEEALEKYKEYEKDIKELETDLQTQAGAIIQDMRVPSKLSPTFSEDFSELLTHMNTLKLPKSTSKEFFMELANEPTCICGREIDEDASEEIQRNAEQFLSDEDVGVLNSIKEKLGNVSEPVDLESRLEELKSTRKELKETEMLQDQLDLQDEDLEERKQELTRDIQEERRQKENKQRKIDYLTTDDKRKREKHNLNWKKNIPEAKREVDKYEKKVKEGTDTVTFSAKADKLESILGKFVRHSIDDVKREQIQKTNNRLDQILKRSSIQIESIDDSINLKNRDGASEGQSLAVAYAYLSTLFEGSAVNMPFVIDSPAVSLDHKVRSEVAPIISELFDQIIAFVISTEKEGFVENLEPDSEDDIKYYTVYQMDEPGEMRTHTDRNFFMDFTSEEEEDETGSQAKQAAEKGE